MCVSALHYLPFQISVTLILLNWEQPSPVCAATNLSNESNTATEMEHVNEYTGSTALTALTCGLNRAGKRNRSPLGIPGLPLVPDYQVNKKNVFCVNLIGL